ncbi:MAG: threonine ammonia-lyase, biosynthetic [Trueperaceae bacterium]
MQEIVRKVLTARVYDVAVETPLESMPRLSERLGRPVLLKREDLQSVYSFKLRGAYNKLAQLGDAAVRAGVICASAGNHAQGVAVAAARLGAHAVVVVPVTTPDIKVQAVRRLGAEVITYGEDFDEAHAHAYALGQESGAIFVHPFDDPDVVAGQGTIGIELLRQHPGELEALFLPIGGGGLAAGVASVVRYLRPEVRLIGVEPADSASMRAAFDAGGPVRLNEVGLFADGVSVKRVGDLTYRLCRDALDDVVTVDTDQICAAIKDIYENCRAIAEPAGAVALAGLKAYAARAGGGAPLVAVHSGANLNFDRLRHVAERAEVGEGNEALLAVGMPERPGSYKRFIHTLGGRAITAFNYRIGDPQRAQILVGVALRGGQQEKLELITGISAAGFTVNDLSDDEITKTHARYMVGGRSNGLEHELLFHFEFPERPDALLHFLESLNPGWNITLFHYRYHGAHYGRVLAGIEAPPSEREQVTMALEKLGYPFREVTRDPSVELFLRG